MDATDTMTLTKESSSTASMDDIVSLENHGRFAEAEQRQQEYDAQLDASTQHMSVEELQEMIQQRTQSERFHQLLRDRDDAIAQYRHVRDTLEQRKKAVENFDDEYSDIRDMKSQVQEAYFHMLDTKSTVDKYKNETAHYVSRLSKHDAIALPEYHGHTVGDAVLLWNHPEYVPGERTLTLGGSDIGTILRTHPTYASDNYRELLDRKVDYLNHELESTFTKNYIGDDDIVRDPAARGDAWEPVIADEFRNQHPELTVMQSNKPWVAQGNHTNRAVVDGLIASDGEHPDGILEIKTSNNPNDWTEGPPANYKAQVQWYLHTTNLEYAYVAARVDDYDYQEHVIHRGEPITNKLGTLEEAQPRIDEFRHRVADRVGADTTPQRSGAMTIERKDDKTSPLTLLANLRGVSERTMQHRLKERTRNKDSFDRAVRNEFKDVKNRVNDEKVYVDIETTGFSSTTNEIIEFAWSRRDKHNNVLEDGTIMCSPDPRFMRANGTGAEHLHGITRDEVSHAPHFRSPEVQQQVQGILNGRTVVSHNSGFEEDFFMQNVEGFHNSGTRIIDSALVSKYFNQRDKSNTLETFAESQQVEYKDAHRAINDVNIMADAMHSILQRERL